MRPKLRPLDQQVIVITGASSGIGLCTARRAAQRGAKVLLVARSTESLAKIAQGIRDAGGEAEFYPADVGRAGSLQDAAKAAARRWGRIDTWVNNAGVSIYGRIEDLPLEDMRKLFETNFWGTVHGSLAALPYLKRNGGTLINVSSMAAERALPLQGIYSAASAAICNFTDALRTELHHEGARVAVSLLKPAAVATPHFENARNYLKDGEPHPLAPAYSPELAAKAILHLACTGQRELTLGESAFLMRAAQRSAPALLDRILERTAFRAQKSHSSLRHGNAGNLFHASPRAGYERGRLDTPVMHRSPLTWAAMHPVLSRFLLLGSLGSGLLAWRLLRRISASPEAQEHGWPSLHERHFDWQDSEAA